MKLFLLALLPLLWTTIAQCAIHTEVIEYQHDKTVLEGYLAYDDSKTGKQPGVLVVHEWTGHNPAVPLGIPRNRQSAALHRQPRQER